jgi:hypothetical protein
LDLIFICHFYFQASDVVTEAEALASKYVNTTPAMLNAEQSPDRLEEMIKNHDVVIRYEKSEVSNILDK